MQRLLEYTSKLHTMSTSSCEKLLVLSNGFGKPSMTTPADHAGRLYYRIPRSYSYQSDFHDLHTTCARHIDRAEVTTSPRFQAIMRRA
jgi:hypothetical protein